MPPNFPLNGLKYHGTTLPYYACRASSSGLESPLVTSQKEVDMFKKKEWDAFFENGIIPPSISKVFDKTSRVIAPIQAILAVPITVYIILVLFGWFDKVPFGDMTSSEYMRHISWELNNPTEIPIVRFIIEMCQRVSS